MPYTAPLAVSVAASSVKVVRVSSNRFSSSQIPGRVTSPESAAWSIGS